MKLLVEILRIGITLGNKYKSGSWSKYRKKSLSLKSLIIQNLKPYMQGRQWEAEEGQRDAYRENDDAT